MERLGGGADGPRRFAPLVVLGVALIAAAVVLLSYGDGLTWFQDSWELLMHRRDPSAAAWLDPHNEHIVLIPVLIEQLSLRIFGMGSMVPEQVVLTALLLGTAVLVFVYAKRRVGPWPALMGTVVLLFLGPAWQDLLWPFQVGFVGSALFGVASLLALERGDRRGDVVAAVCIAVSVGFSSLGLPFAVAAAVEVLLRRRERGLGRIWVAAVPAALYAIWWAGWGHTAENHLSAHNVLVSPGYVLEGLEASLDSLLALATIFGEPVGRSDWALPLLIVLLAVLVYALFRGRRLDPGLWPPLAAAATFWFLAGFNQIPGREAWSSRYLYVGALFGLLIVANLLRGVRFNRPAILVGAVITGVVVGFNLVPLREGRDFFRSQTVLTRADLGAIEIAADSVDPGFTLPPEISGTSFLNEIEAGEYLRAVEEFGSPAYDPRELAAAPEAGAEQADIVLANALPLQIETEAAPPSARGECRRLSPDQQRMPAPAPGVTTIELGPGGEGTIGLRRFARAGYPLVAEDLAGGSTTSLKIPADRAARPWRLRVEAPAGATVCRVDQAAG